MIELIRSKRMKDRFKREFGATIDEFMDEEPVNIQNTAEADPNQVVMEEEGDDEMLDRLLKAN